MDGFKEIISSIAQREASRLAQAGELSVGLLGGDMGSVLFLYEYSRLDESYHSVADSMLDKVLASLHAKSHIPTYCGGVAGMAVGLDALNQNGFIGGLEDAMSPVDRNLSSSLTAMLRMNQHDFLHGFIGLGFYWLMRHRQGDKAHAAEQLGRILDHLGDSCERANGVVRWHLPESRLVRPYNISISHGCSSTVILLSGMLLSGVLPDRREEIEVLLRGAVDYILQNRLDTARFGCWFASTSLDCERPHRSRLAWCYVDLGVAVALNRAAEALDDDSIRMLSSQVLEYSALHRRNLGQNLVFDACVCHGSAGVGLVMREMSRRLDSATLSDAADYWRDRTMDMAVDDAQGTTFPFYDVTAKRRTIRRSILEGDVGVAMYLLGEITDSPLAGFLLLN